MRLRLISIPALFMLLGCFFLLPSLVKADESQEYIAISKQGAGRISVVLDNTSAMGGKEAEWARRLDIIMHNALDFSGQFNLLPAPLNVRIAGEGGVNLQMIKAVGAEIYSGGSVSSKTGSVILDMAVYDVFTGRQLLRKSYTGTDTRLRSIGFAFCADLVELLTGKKSLLFNSKIAFVSNRTGFKEIYLCDFDGENVSQVTTSKSIALTPALSPDGRFLAYTDYVAGRPQLVIRKMADNTSVTVKKAGTGIDPAWRNAAECATTLSFEGDQEIYLIKTDGTVSRRLTYSTGIDVSPTFSPDGAKMAFVSQRSGMPQIFVQDLQSGASRRLTYSGNYNTQPSWSPDGAKIAYSSWQKNGEMNIFIINVDGTGLIQLTAGSKDNESPCWSPDGSMIVFVSSRQGRKKLFVMNADGTSQRLLLRMEGDQQQPSWSMVR